MIAIHELQDELGDLINATQIIPNLLRCAGKIGGGRRGLSGEECEILGVVINSFTDDLNQRYFDLIDRTCRDKAD